MGCIPKRCIPASSNIQGEGEPEISPSFIPSSGDGESNDRRATLVSLMVPRHRLCKFGEEKGIACKKDLCCDECKTSCCSNCSSMTCSQWNEFDSYNVCNSCSSLKSQTDKDFRLLSEIDYLGNQVEMQTKILLEVLSRLPSQDAGEE